MNSTGTLIAVVEDEPGTRRMLGALLERRGFTPLLFESGSVFLESVDAHPPHLVLLDISLGQSDTEGIDLCRALRSRFSMNTLPVLMVTAHTSERILVESFSAGANDYIAKPVRPVELIARIQTQLRIMCSTRTILRIQEEVAAQQRLETVGLFATGVAHNLNNALGIIQGSAEMLVRAGGDPNRQRKYVDLILQATKQSSELISNLRVLNSQSDEHGCDGASVTRSTFSLMRAVAGNRVVLDLQIEPNLPLLACPEPDLAVVLSHLLRRAISSIEGEGWIRVQLAEKAPGLCRLTVQDSGRRIPEERHKSMFDAPCENECDSAGDQGAKGTGAVQTLWVLGQVAQRARGSIRVVESSTEGTIIEFLIPSHSVSARTGELDLGVHAEDTR